MQEEECCLHFLTLLWIVWWHSKGRPHAVPKRFKEKLVGLSHLLTIETCNENEWLIPDDCGNFVFFSVTEANFWLNLQPTASRQATTCLQSLHFTCVLGLTLIPHRKCPATHAKHTRRANASFLEQQRRGTCKANATRFRGPPLMIEQTNTRASRLV